MSREDVDVLGDAAGHVEVERWTFLGPPAVEKTHEDKRGTTSKQITWVP